MDDKLAKLGYQAKDGARKPKKNPVGAPDAARANPAAKVKELISARPVSDFGLQGVEIFQ